MTQKRPHKQYCRPSLLALLRRGFFKLSCCSILIITTITAAQARNDNVWQYLRNNFSLNVDLNQPEIQRQIKILQSNKPALRAMLARGEPYIYYLAHTTVEHHMPAELALLPILESTFNASAHSNRGAAGLWQMMPSTAKRYGTTQNGWFDGRKDVVQSTAAAMRYLAMLHTQMHGNWLLALAAYNSGPGTIFHAMRTNNGWNRQDIWNLNLPRETRNYIPKFLALVAIVNNPQKYGIDLNEIPNQPYFAAIKTKNLDLMRTAKLTNISIKEIRRLNPGYTQQVINKRNINQDDFVVLLPVVQAANYTSSQQLLPLHYTITKLQDKIKQLYS